MLISFGNSYCRSIDNYMSNKRMKSKKGKAIVKDMESGEQEEIKLERIGESFPMQMNE